MCIAWFVVFGRSYLLLYHLLAACAGTNPWFRGRTLLVPRQGGAGVLFPPLRPSHNGRALARHIVSLSFFFYKKKKYQNTTA